MKPIEFMNVLCLCYMIVGTLLFKGFWFYWCVAFIPICALNVAKEINTRVEDIDC